MTELTYQSVVGSPTRRLRLVRWIIYLAATASLCWIITLTYRTGVVQRALIHWRLNQCGAYVAPANRIVYEEHNGPAAKLGFSPKQMSELPITDITGTRRWIGDPPPLGAIDQTGKPAATIFLGQLQAADGTRATTCVQIPATTPEPAGILSFKNTFNSEKVRNIGIRTNTEIELIDPLNQGSKRTDTISRLFLFQRDGLEYAIDFANRAEVYRFYAGQRDPKDASRFTIDFDADDRKVRAHCRLMSVGVLQIRLESLTPDSANTPTTRRTSPLPEGEEQNGATTVRSARVR